MALQVNHRHGGVVIVVHDPAESALLGDVAGQLATGAPLSVVVDVTSVTTGPTEGIERLVSELRAAATMSGAQRWSIVAGHATARHVLRQLCADSPIGVYPDVDQALDTDPHRGLGAP